MSRIGPGESVAGQGSASIASRLTPAWWAAWTMRTPISRVRMQRLRPLCASLAITTDEQVNPHFVNSSTEHQPSIAARLLPVAQQSPPERSAFGLLRYGDGAGTWVAVLRSDRCRGHRYGHRDGQR